MNKDFRINKNGGNKIKKKEDLEKELITLLLPISDFDIVIKNKDIKKTNKASSKQIF